MLEEVAFVFFGIFLGTITGLVPGIHVNTVVILVLTLLPRLLREFEPLSLVALIVAMAAVHTYVDYIPSIFLGAPGEDSVLSVLPGHRMFLKGRGYEAVQLTVVGGVGATLVSALLLIPGLATLPIIYGFITPFVPYLLVGIILFIILIQNRGRGLYAAIAVFYSGLLGFLLLDRGVINLSFALFPALTGLFGISTLLVSLGSRLKVQPQEISSQDFEYKKGVVVGSFAGLLAGLLPSVGSSQSATIVQGLFGRGDEKEFLVALGGVNTANSIYAFLALYLIGRTRSGASIAVNEIIGGLRFSDMLFIVAVTLFTTFFAVVITLELARLAARSLPAVNYQRLSVGIITFLFILSAFLTGLKGLLILITASAIGVLVQVAGVNRSSCMAVLMVPTILYFI